MLFKPLECVGCELYNQHLEQNKVQSKEQYEQFKAGRGFSKPDGKGNAGVVVYLESLGDNEVEDGLPVRPHAPAGSVFQRVINRSPGLSRDDFAIYNTIQCQPPWNKLGGTAWGDRAISHCQVHRQNFMGKIPTVGKKYKQRIILALGAVPFKTLTGLEGQYLNLSDIRGYPIDTPDGVVIGSYHPSHILQGAQKLMGVLMLDMRMAVHYAKNGFVRKPVKYQEYPGLDEARSYLQRVKDNRNMPLAFDIETPDVDETRKIDRINSIQFSLEPQTGIFFPWQGEYADISREILSLENEKVGHNVWRFDAPVLRDVGGIRIGGVIHDSLWCLANHTQIALWDGTHKKIEDIVENKLEITVVGMDDKGHRIPVKVTNWHKTKVKNQKWLNIKCEGSRYPIYVTPDHKIYANGKWKLAEEVQEGDILRLPTKGTNALIHGTILGDGSVTKKGDLALRHSIKQKEWFLAKARHVGASGHEIKTQWGGEILGSTFIGTHWRKKFYPEGKKTFIAPSSNAALAVWYCDDGCWKKLDRYTGRMDKFKYKKPKDFITGDGTAILCFGDMLKPEAAVAWLKMEFGNDIALNGPSNNKQIHIKKSSRDKFFSAIASYVHPSMEYKLPEKYRGKYCGWLENDVSRVGKVIQVKEEISQRIKSSARYCIDVDHPTHRFFTLGGLVHNCFHHYQPDLTLEEKDDDVGMSTRMGLQYAASFFGMDFHWKHMKFYKEQQRYYGIADVDATQRIWSKLPKAMKALGVWKGYEKLRLGLDPVLVNMQDRGIPVDEFGRVELESEIEDDKELHFRSMQQVVPDELKNHIPKDGYKKGWPKDKEGKINGKEWFDEDNQCWWPIQEITASDGEVRPARVVPFKPSNDQLVKYIKYKNHPVPKKKVKDERKIVETGEQKELVKLYRKTHDPLYKSVLDYRGCETALSRYTNKWAAGNDGRVHSQFMYVPASGQLNSIKPNAQNFIKHAQKDGVDRKYAERLRGLIRAEPGHTLQEVDFSGFHSLTTGFEARDVDLMRLARLDIHSFVTAHFACLQKLIPTGDLPDLKWSDKDLGGYLANIKKKYKNLRDTKCKPSILGYGFGMGPNKLYTQNEDTMTLREAKNLMKLLDELFPVAKKWRTDIKQLADRQGFLISKFGFIRWFWDVYTRKKVDGVWQVHNGSDAEDAIAFLPSNSAHGHMQETMIMLEYGLKHGWCKMTDEDVFMLDVERALGVNYNEKFRLINMIHDSLLFEVPNKYLDESLEVTKRIMERPSTILVDPKVAPKGLVCAVEQLVGPAWDKMTKVV